MGMRYSQKITDNFGQAMKRIDQEGQKSLMAATIEWHKAVRKKLSGTRSGKTYELPGTKKTYVASAPGEAPAVRFGDLRRKYKFVIKRGYGLVGNPLDYAADLELGTSEIKPRPHLRPAFEENRKAIMAHFERKWVK